MKSIVSFHVDAALAGGRPGRGPELRHSADFELFEGLTLKLDAKAGGQVTTTVICPPVGRAHVRIAHLPAAGARWLGLCCALPLAELALADRLIVSLRASAPQTITLFALLRLHNDDGSWSETSSVQIEVRRREVAHVCPISLDDLPPRAQARASRASLMVFFEPRGGTLDLAEIDVIAVPCGVQGIEDADLRHLRSSADVRRSALLDVAPSWTEGHHVDLGGSLYLDTDPAAAVPLLSALPSGGLRIELAGSPHSAWQSLEFRFADVPDSPGLAALLRLDGCAEAEPGARATVLLRRYLPEGTWADSGPVATLTLPEAPETLYAVVDLYPFLEGTQERHDFGLMLFLPPECRTLSLLEAEALVYDRDRCEMGRQ